MKKKRKVVLSLGSNIGDRKNHIERAIYELEKEFNFKIESSRLYETTSWGFDAEALFLNCCVSFISDCNPMEVLFVTQMIEKKIGRVKKSQKNIYESRTIDIDILYVGELIVSTKNLTVPHPLIYDRLFVLKPLSELCAELVDPVKKRTVFQILAECNDQNKVILYED